MTARDPVARPPALPADWDRLRPWTLRFADGALERSYREATARPAGQRLRIACTLGAGIWVSLGALGPPLLAIAPGPIYAAGLGNAAWELVVALLTLRGMSLSTVWAFAVVTTTVSALSIPLAFGTGTTFVTIGAAALMTNGVFGIALVRLAGWLAAVLSAMAFVVFVAAVLAFGVGGTEAYQGVLLIGLMAAA